MFESIKTIPSSDENVVKFVFESKDAVAEAVLYKYPTYEDRTVICCSTQSGCPVGCVFCGTGKFFTRNLTAEEIVAQVKYAVDYTGVDVSSVKKFQIMFMSMGEPLLNYDELENAIQDLNLLYENAQLLVSTTLPFGTEKINTGIGPNIFGRFIKLSELIPAIGIQFSVHESYDIARNKLIPSRTNSLCTIGRVGELWNSITKRRPFFNYCVHDGNNTDLDVNRLLACFKPSIWEVTLSVICEKDQSMKNAIEDKLTLVTDFAPKMAAAGYSTRVFNPAGQDDIGGGCGQLWFVQEWAKKYKDEQCNLPQ